MRMQACKCIPTEDQKDAVCQIKRLCRSLNCWGLIELVDQTLGSYINMMDATMPCTCSLQKSPEAALTSTMLGWAKRSLEKHGLNHKYPRLFIAIIYGCIQLNTEEIDKNDCIIAPIMSELIYYFDKIITNYRAIHKYGSIEKYRRALKMYENNDSSNKLFYQSIVNQIIHRLFFGNKHIINTMMFPLEYLVHTVLNARCSKPIDRYFCHILKNWIKLQNTYSTQSYPIETMRMIAHIIDHGITAYVNSLSQNNNIDYNCNCNNYIAFTSSKFYIENIVNKKIGRYSSDHLEKKYDISNNCDNNNNNMNTFVNNLESIVKTTLKFVIKRLLFYKKNPKKLKSDLDWDIFKMTLLILTTCLQYYLWCNCDLSKIVSLCNVVKLHAFAENTSAKLGNRYTHDRLEANMIKYFIKSDWYSFKKMHQKLTRYARTNEQFDSCIRKHYKQFGSILRSMLLKSKNSNKMKIQTLCKIEMYHNKYFSISKFNKYFKQVLNCDHDNNSQNINQTIRFFKNLSSFKECHWTGCLNKNKKLRKCKNCQCVYYCSRLCQKLDWKMYYRCKQTGKYFLPHKQSCDNNRNCSGFQKRDCVWLSFDCIYELKQNGLLK